MKLRFIALFATLLFGSLISKAQVMYPENRIVVVGESTIEIPADYITFQVMLQYTHPTDIKQAFAEHKEAEAKLLTIVRGLNIPNKDINYSLITVEKNYVYNQVTNKQDIVFGTRQYVTFTVKDVKRYGEIMFKLIDTGFREVSASFASSKEKEFNDTLIKNAIASATQKAEAMAKFSNRKIQEIINISETMENDPIQPRMEMMKTAAYAGGDANNFAEIPQSIKKSLQLKVVFSLVK